MDLHFPDFQRVSWYRSGNLIEVHNWQEVSASIESQYCRSAHHKSQFVKDQFLRKIVKFCLDFGNLQDDWKVWQSSYFCNFSWQISKVSKDLLKRDFLLFTHLWSTSERHCIRWILPICFQKSLLLMPHQEFDFRLKKEINLLFLLHFLPEHYLSKHCSVYWIQTSAVGLQSGQSKLPDVSKQDLNREKLAIFSDTYQYILP